MPRPVAILRRLLDEKAAVARTGPTDPIFLKWHQESLQILRTMFGAASAFTSDFEQIKFQINPSLAGNAKRLAKKLIHTDRNVSKMLPLELDHAKAHRFEQAMADATEILLTARNELVARSKK